MKTKTPITYNGHPVHMEKEDDVDGPLIKFIFINDEGNESFNHLAFDNSVYRDEHFQDIVDGKTTDW